jgi:hypothetical protein
MRLSPRARSAVGVLVAALVVYWLLPANCALIGEDTGPQGEARSVAPEGDVDVAEVADSRASLVDVASRPFFEEASAESRAVEPTGSLEVSVLAFDGVGPGFAAFGAGVELRGARVRRSASTSESGTALFGALAAGRYEVSVEYPGYADGLIEAVWVADGPRSCEVRLVRHGALDVDVVLGGVPLADIDVAVAPQSDSFAARSAYEWTPSDSPRHRRARSGATGRATFEDLRPGAYVVDVVDASRFAARKVARIQVGARVGCRLELVESPSLPITVVDAASRLPVSGVPVLVIAGGGRNDGMRGRELRWSGRSDAAGRLEAPYLAGKALNASSGGPAFFGRGGAPICYGDPITLTVERPRSYFVEVVRDDGSTVDRGEFDFADLTERRSVYSVAEGRAHRFDAPTPFVERLCFVVENGRATAEIDLRKEAAQGRGTESDPIRARLGAAHEPVVFVVAADGRPAPFATVVVERRPRTSLYEQFGRRCVTEATCARDGRVAVCLSAIHDYALSAEHPSLGYVERELSEADRRSPTIELRLEPAVDVAMTCRIDGVPFAHGLIQLARTQSSVRTLVRSGTTDDRGVVRLAAVPPGDYRVLASGVEFNPRKRGLPLPIGAPVVSVRVGATEYAAELR